MSRGSLIEVKLLNNGLDFGTDLSSTWPSSNDGNIFARKVVICAPLGAVPLLTLEIFPTRYLSEFGPVEVTTIVEQNSSKPQLFLFGSSVLSKNFPLEGFLIPRSFVDQGRKLGTLAEICAIRQSTIVLLDLAATSKRICPI